MPGPLRRLLDSPANKAIAVAVALLLCGVTVYSVWKFVHGDEPIDPTHSMYVDTETGKPFPHENQIGESIPIVSPFTGRNTGVPAEPCFWTADGEAKKEPTWVMINESVGSHEPTFCRDCGRLVVGHNPRPGPGVRPPPRKHEYLAAHPSRSPSPGDQAREASSRHEAAQP